MTFSLVSVLFMGMWHGGNASVSDVSLLQNITVAPPAEEMVVDSRLSASGVIVIDRLSGQSVYGKQAQVRRPMASITKLMTALIITENHALDEIVTIPKAAESIVGNKAYFKAGERYTVGDVLSALLISSANDAAYTLAVFHAGSSDNFVQLMNKRAKELGLVDTSYANPSGLDHPDQYSTPRDIALLTNYVLSKEPIALRMKRRWDRIVSIEGTEIPLAHTHQLIQAGTGGVVAGKTGTTLAAHQCLVSVFTYEGREYIMVLLRSDNRYADTKVLLSILRNRRPSMV